MEQKIIWMRFFLIGISALLAISNTGCKQVDYQVRAKYIYINETGSNISYTADWQDFNVNANDSIIYETDDDGPESIKESDFIPPLASCDPCAVFFGTELCDTLLIEDENSPLEIENYQSRKLGERYYEFTFYYTQDMIDNADQCK